MRRRFAIVVLLLAVTLPLSGCPAGPAVALGLWLMSIDENTSFVGFALLPDGEIDEFAGGPAPPGASILFKGEVTWEQNGTGIVFLHDGMSHDTIYNATLQSSTYMTGSWQDLGGSSSSGFFVATKAPVN